MIRSIYQLNGGNANATTEFLLEQGAGEGDQVNLNDQPQAMSQPPATATQNVVPTAPPSSAPRSRAQNNREEAKQEIAPRKPKKKGGLFG
mmetsp:Transcript_542/g.538  ORF Transcript_542/g.538 Transcript_542/m.538 type:complete len:90 (+) Transcript_542:365-634(+)